MEDLIILRPDSLVDRQKRKSKKKGAPRHTGKIKLTRKGKKGNTLDCGHLNVEYFLVHKNLATTSLP